MNSFQSELVALVMRHGQRLPPEQLLEVLKNEITALQKTLDAQRAINNTVDEAAKNPIS